MQPVTFNDVITLRDFFAEALSVMPNSRIESEWDLIKQVALILDIDPPEFEQVVGFHWNQFDEVDIDSEEYYVI